MANFITLSRLPLLALILVMLFTADFGLRLAASGLIVLLILMDSLDGFVARRRQETSLLGSALDIATDRAVELLLWVTFAALGLIPFVIPLVVIARGTLTDSIRAVAVSRGVRAFEIQRAPGSRFLVASPAMRTSYAIAKAAAFFLLALNLALQSAPPPAKSPTWLGIASQGLAWTAFALCLARGLPVLIEAPAYFREHEPAEK